MNIRSTTHCAQLYYVACRRQIIQMYLSRIKNGGTLDQAFQDAKFLSKKLSVSPFSYLPGKCTSFSKLEGQYRGTLLLKTYSTLPGLSLSSEEDIQLYLPKTIKYFPKTKKKIFPL